MESVPPEIVNSLDLFRQKHPDPGRTAFLMMQFGKTSLHRKIEKAVKKALGDHGITGIRADDGEYHDDLWPNVRTYLHGCGLGIAVFERIEDEAFNPNVSLEVGYMLALRKPVCLLTDSTLPRLQTDLKDKLYKEFSTQDPSRTIVEAIGKWLSEPRQMAALGGIQTTRQLGPVAVAFATSASRKWIGLRVQAELVNKGSCDLHIRKVVLKYSRIDYDGKRVPVSAELAPENALRGRLLAHRRPINEDEPSKWKMRFHLVGQNAACTKYLLQTAAEADPSTLSLDVWAEENPDSPLWHAEGDELAQLQMYVRSMWLSTVTDHPCYERVRGLLGLGEDAKFTDWEELKALAKTKNYGSDVEDDSYVLRARRKIDGVMAVRLSRTLFDQDGRLMPMLPEEWRPELVNAKMYRRSNEGMSPRKSDEYAG